MTTLTTTLVDLDPLLIDCDPTQPRQEIDADAQAELAASIAAQGVLVPLTVVPTANGRYTLLYGERRLHAARTTQHATVPCLVATAPPTWDAALDVQLTENLLRSDLRPLEVAQSLYRRMLGANIAALEAEQGDDGTTTTQLLAQYLTPTGQIAVLEDRLCTLAGVDSSDAYFGSGRVRVPRTPILARYGMGQWSASCLKKLFQTLDVAPSMQDALAGIDVSARTLRELGQHDPATQADLVTTAMASGGDVGTALRSALRTGDPADQELRDPGEPLPLLPAAGDASSFVPDPSLAFLTSSGGSAERLITDRPAPERGRTPSAGHAVWSADAVLQLEGALEAALTVCTGAGAAHLTESQITQLTARWGELMERLHQIGLAS